MISEFFKQYIIDENPTNLGDIQTGDIIRFVYEGEPQYILVLNPNFDTLLHGLKIEKLARHQINYLSMLAYRRPPLSFYLSYLKGQSYADHQSLNAYRTYDLRKVGDLFDITYNVGFNFANPNTILSAGNSFILGCNESGHLWSEPYTQLYGLFNSRASVGGVWVPWRILPVNTREFARRLKTFSTLSKWTYSVPKDRDMSDEQIETETVKILSTVIQSKALIIMTDDQIDQYGFRLGAVRL